MRKKITTLLFGCLLMASSLIASAQVNLNFTSSSDIATGWTYTQSTGAIINDEYFAISRTASNNYATGSYAPTGGIAFGTDRFIAVKSSNSSINVKLTNSAGAVYIGVSNYSSTLPLAPLPGTKFYIHLFRISDFTGGTLPSAGALTCSKMELSTQGGTPGVSAATPTVYIDWIKSFSTEALMVQSAADNSKFDIDFKAADAINDNLNFWQTNTFSPTVNDAPTLTADNEYMQFFPKAGATLPATTSVRYNPGTFYWDMTASKVVVLRINSTTTPTIGVWAKNPAGGSYFDGSVVAQVSPTTVPASTDKLYIYVLPTVLTNLSGPQWFGNIKINAPTQNSGDVAKVDFIKTFASLSDANTYVSDYINARLTVTVTPGTYTYTGSAQGPDATNTSNTGTGTSYTFSYVGTGSTTYAASATKPTNAGTYTVTATVAANGSFVQRSSSATAFTIGKATPTLSISGTPTTFGYTGSAQGPTVSVTNNSAGTQTFAYTSTDGGGYSSTTAPTNAGAYQVTVSVATTTNYLAAGPSNAIAFTISKATPTLSISGTPTTFAYSGSAQGPTVSVTNNSGGTQTFAYTSTDGGGYSSTAAPTNAGAYQVTVSVATTTNYIAAGPSNAIAFTISSTTTWNGTSWNLGAPTAVLDAVVDGTLTTSGALTAKSLTVNSGKSLTIASGTNVTVQNAVTNNGGTVTIENNANLIQVNDVTNTGSVTVKRNSNALKRLDYTMWSSPVSGQNLFNFSQLTSASAPSIRFYTYSSSTNKYVAIDPVANAFTTGNGYLIRMPNVNPATQVALASDPYFAGTIAITYAGSFTGTLNNGTVTLSGLTADKYYSIGNPYPSTISATAFIDGNTITSALYFWRKTNGGGTAYATYTKLGATAGSGGITPNGKIQVGQGFIAKAAGSSLSFTNIMRIANNEDQFLKTKKVADKSRLWLDLSDATGRMNQVLVGYLDGATLGFDAGIDGKYFNDSKTALTSIVEAEEYVIQGRPTFDATDVVALGFKTDVAGDYTIALNSFDGLFAEGQDVYLVDAVVGKEIDLKAGSYSFTASAGADNARFSLKYQKTLKVDAPSFNENSVKVYKNNGSIVVNSTAKAIKTIAVYDVQGRLIAQQKNVNATTATISNLKAVRQVLIVKVSADDNSVVTKKVLN